MYYLVALITTAITFLLAFGGAAFIEGGYPSQGGRCVVVIITAVFGIILLIAAVECTIDAEKESEESQNENRTGRD